MNLLLTTRMLLLGACVLSMLAPSAYAQQTDPMAQRIEAQMAKPDRHRFDLPRDAGRKPYALFKFLGIEAGMTVMDVAAYAGYTTEMMAAAVGPAGKVYSQNTRQVLERYAEGYYQRTMAERLRDNRLPNVEMLICEYTELGHANEIDVAFLGNMLHDFYNFEGEAQTLAYLRAIYRALKPGGVLGVSDHVGVDGADNRGLHRLAPHIARSLLLQAGFTVEAQSDLYANPSDSHALMVYDEKIYRHTDRFLLRARKPL